VHPIYGPWTYSIEFPFGKYFIIHRNSLGPCIFAEKSL
jgi:hypothetical protein